MVRWAMSSVQPLIARSSPTFHNRKRLNVSCVHSDVPWQSWSISPRTSGLLLPSVTISSSTPKPRSTSESECGSRPLETQKPSASRALEESLAEAFGTNNRFLKDLQLGGSSGIRWRWRLPCGQLSSITITSPGNKSGIYARESTRAGPAVGVLRRATSMPCTRIDSVNGPE
eukprot:4797969-Prymnesium_polylepis.3